MFTITDPTVEEIVEASLPIVKAFEGLRLSAYQDVGGVWTIGYGQTGPDITEGTVWTEEEATQRLQESVSHTVATLVPLFTSDALQGRLGALAAIVSLTYNVGLHAIENSTLLRLVNEGDLTSAADQFVRWDRAAGSVQEIMVIRRAKERELFLNGIAVGS